MKKRITKLFELSKRSWNLGWIITIIGVGLLCLSILGCSTDEKGAEDGNDGDTAGDTDEKNGDKTDKDEDTINESEDDERDADSGESEITDKETDEVDEPETDDADSETTDTPEDADSGEIEITDKETDEADEPKTDDADSETTDTPEDDANETDSDGGTIDAGADDDQIPLPGTVPIDPPVADNCITDVSAGDHSFTCDGITYLVMVDEKCSQYACGLIFDVHGATMNGQIMRTCTQLHNIAPSKGYLVVHPEAPSSTWDWDSHPSKLTDFMTRMTKAFHVDERRIHVTGFSMGAAMTFWFLCNHREVIASTAPVTGSSASQVTIVETNEPCIESIDADWQPRVPILFMSGSKDVALTLEQAEARTEGIVTRLGLEGGDEIDSGDGYTRKRWVGDDGMVFDFLVHDYSASGFGETILGGHCIPGSNTDNFYACAGDNALKWGEVVLEWFIEHPRNR